MKISFGYYISIIYRHLQIYVNQKFTKYGFGSGQYMFFIHIAEEKGISQKELSRKLAIDKATTAKAIKKLTELGFISAIRNEKDKRSYNLYLTDRGKEIQPEVRTIISDTTLILQQGMSFEEIEISAKLMDRMLENIIGKVEEIRSLNE